MKIVDGYPPNIKQIQKKFKIHRGVVFTYGDTLFAPGLDPNLSDHLVLHETCHFFQQGSKPALWWKRYLVDVEFRLDQELEAYRMQYRLFCQGNKDRNIRARFLGKIAADLSGPMYGSIINWAEAMESIKK